MYQLYWAEDSGALARNPKLKRLFDSVRARPAVERIWRQHFPNAGDN